LFTYEEGDREEYPFVSCFPIRFRKCQPGWFLVTAISENNSDFVNPKQNEKSTFMTKLRSVFLRILAIVLGLISLFFIFYTARLLYVTHGLTQIRGGGNGTYIGAVAFPLLAPLFGLGAWRCVKSSRRVGS
jgi:hypothetical protein